MKKLLFFFVALLSLVAATPAANAKRSIMELPPFERAVLIIKKFETLHKPKHWPYYPKEMIIQRDGSDFFANERIISKTFNSTLDNNRIRPSFQTIRRDGVKVHLPLDKIVVSSDFGIRRDPFTKKSRWHSGIDLRAKHGQKAYATLPGIVKTVGRDRGRGIFVSLIHGDYTLTYCHLSRAAVKPRQAVYAGEVVGYVGSTGRSTGPHLHLSLHKGAEVLTPGILLRYLFMKIRQWEAINVCQDSLAIPSMICQLAI